MQKESNDNSRIVKALKGGDQSDFQFIYKSYCCPLCSYAFKTLKDKELACEVVQDTFMAVGLNLKTLDENKSLRCYLLRAVHNNSLRLLQLEEARQMHEDKAMWELDETELLEHLWAHEVESSDSDVSLDTDFEDECLETLALRLSRLYGIRIEVDDRLKSCAFSGKISYERGVDYITRLMAETDGIVCQVEDGVIKLK